MAEPRREPKSRSAQIQSEIELNDPDSDLPAAFFRSLLEQCVAHGNDASRESQGVVALASS